MSVCAFLNDTSKKGIKENGEYYIQDAISNKVYGHPSEVNNCD